MNVSKYMRYVFKPAESGLYLCKSLFESCWKYLVTTGKRLVGWVDSQRRYLQHGTVTRASPAATLTPKAQDRHCQSIDMPASGHALLWLPGLHYWCGFMWRLQSEPKSAESLRLSMALHTVTYWWTPALCLELNEVYSPNNGLNSLTLHPYSLVTSSADEGMNGCVHGKSMKGVWKN